MTTSFDRDYAIVQKMPRNPIVVADIIERYLEQGWKRVTFARRFHISQQSVCNYLSVRNLPSKYVYKLRNGKMTLKVARAFVHRMEDNPNWELHMDVFTSQEMSSMVVEKYTHFMVKYPTFSPQQIIELVRRATAPTGMQEPAVPRGAGPPQGCKRCGGRVLYDGEELKCFLCAWRPAA